MKRIHLLLLLAVLWIAAPAWAHPGIGGCKGANPLTLGDVTYGANCAVQLNAGSVGGPELVDLFEDGDVLNLSDIVPDTTEDDGLILPGPTSCTGATNEGQICWNRDTDILTIGTGSTPKAMGDIETVGGCRTGACFDVIGAPDGEWLGVQENLEIYLDQDSTAGLGQFNIRDSGDSVVFQVNEAGTVFSDSGIFAASATSDTLLTLGTDNHLIVTRPEAGAVVFMGKDNDANADTVYDTSGDGQVFLGSADVAAIVASTNGTGDSEVQLPAQSISGTEITDNTVTDLDLDSTARGRLNSHVKSITVESPGGAENITLWRPDRDIFVNGIHSVTRGTSPSVTWNIHHDTDRSDTASPGKLFATNQVTTSATTGDNDTPTSGSETVAAGEWIWLVTTAMSGTVAEISWTIDYQYND